MVNPYVALGAIFVVIVTHGVAYTKGRADGADSEIEKQQEKVEAWRLNAEAASELYEAEKAKKAPQIRTIYKTKEVVRAANPDFSKCRAGDDGLRVLNDRIDLINSGLTASGVPASR